MQNIRHQLVGSHPAVTEGLVARRRQAVRSSLLTCPAASTHSWPCRQRLASRRPPGCPGKGRFNRSIIVLSISFCSTKLLRLIIDWFPLCCCCCCWPCCCPCLAGVDAPLEPFWPVGERPPGAEAAYPPLVAGWGRAPLVGLRGLCLGPPYGGYPIPPGLL